MSLFFLYITQWVLSFRWLGILILRPLYLVSLFLCWKYIVYVPLRCLAGCPILLPFPGSHVFWVCETMAFSVFPDVLDLYPRLVLYAFSGLDCRCRFSRPASRSIVLGLSRVWHSVQHLFYVSLFQTKLFSKINSLRVSSYQQFDSNKILKTN